MSAATPADILVVDDDRTTLVLLEAALVAAGHSVRAVQDGEAAVAAFRAKRADVVLSDIGLPGMDGLTLLRALRDVDLDVPVVLITGRPALESAIQAVEFGALSYLVKPVATDALLEAVDQAIQIGKLARVRRELLVLSGRTDGQVGDRVGLESAFGAALEALWLAYQPIVRWSNRSIFAYEALVRSREPRLPHPGALIDAAERLDRLNDLGRAIRGRAEAPPDALLFLNLHPMDLLDDDLFEPEAPLTRIGNRVVLELTERASLDHVPELRNRIDQLRALGFRIAIDDLGAGYAGLSAFAALSPDVAKLDMSLVRGVDQDRVRQRLMGSMIGLCRDLGVELVAEGVETPAERDTLVDLGCDLMQGYLFCRPAPPFPGVSW